MRILKMILSISLILFLLFTPAELSLRARESFADSRFIRTTERYNGTIVLYHIVRERPFQGSLTAWLTARAEAYEKKHKGTYILIEGMDEAHFLERIEQGRVPDAYSFFSGSLWADRLCEIPDLCIPFKEGISQTAKAVPYGFTGYVKLTKTDQTAGTKIYTNQPVLSARIGVDQPIEEEDKADTLYLDLRRAADLIRYREGFASAAIEPLDNVTEAVCWLGIDQNCDPRKYDVILDFFNELLTCDDQLKLNELGMLSVRSDVRDVPPDPMLRSVFKEYRSIRTFDPFLWQREYDALLEDALLTLRGDPEARNRFTIRLQELYS
jgi:hypothetical protein